MTKKYSLINFNLPKSTKDRFDEMCRLSERTRTSVLVDMIDSFILVKGIQLEEENKTLKKVDQAISERRRLMSFKEYVHEQKSGDQNQEPLAIFHR